MPDWKKLISGKIAIAKKGNKPSKHSGDPRIPPGQKEVTDFPVLDLGIKPSVSITEWQLRVFGLVENPLDLNWTSFNALPQIHDVSDFHCVTRWSQLDMCWNGVQVREILDLAKPLANANYATMYSHDGYTTNLPIEALLDDDVLIAHSVFGKLLTEDHGGPARMVVPKRYAWKGAKWLKAIELHEYDRPGFWELRGYHNEGFPFQEQRFSEDDF